MWNLDINAFYFHSLILGKDEALFVLDNIFKTGKILSLNKGGYDSKIMRMNTDEEICLSKRNNLEFYGSAYDLFARKKLSLIIKGTLPGIYRPAMVSEFESINHIGTGETDLEGEYRVKDEISLDYVVGLNLPVGFILDSMFGYKYFFSTGDELRKIRFVREEKRISDTVEFYNSIKNIMDKYNVDLPIYDIDKKKQIINSEDIVKIKRKR